MAPAEPVKGRPKTTKMEGMIWNAHHVLDNALSETANGIPAALVQRCKGVVLMCVEEAGIVLSGNIGTGVIVKKTGDEWSAPSAIGAQGLGLGFHGGAATKDLVVLLMDEKLVDKISSRVLQWPKLAGQSAVTEGKVSRNDDLDTFREKDTGAWGFLMTTGIFGGISLESMRVHAHNRANGKFYGGGEKRKVTAKEIFDGEVTIPEGSRIPELHQKLTLLSQGKTLSLTDADLAVKESLRVEAEKAAEADPEAEAEKGEEEKAAAEAEPEIVVESGKSG